MSLRFRHIWPIKCHERRVLAVLLVAKASEGVVSTALQGGLRAKAQPLGLCGRRLAQTFYRAKSRHFCLSVIPPLASQIRPVIQMLECVEKLARR